MDKKNDIEFKMPISCLTSLSPHIIVRYCAELQRILLRLWQALHPTWCHWLWPGWPGGIYSAIYSRRVSRKICWHLPAPICNTVMNLFVESISHRFVQRTNIRENERKEKEKLVSCQSHGQGKTNFNCSLDINDTHIHQRPRSVVFQRFWRTIKSNWFYDRAQGHFHDSMKLRKRGLSNGC